MGLFAILNAVIIKRLTETKIFEPRQERSEEGGRILTIWQKSKCKGPEVAGWPVNSRNSKNLEQRKQRMHVRSKR